MLKAIILSVLLSSKLFLFAQKVEVDLRSCQEMLVVLKYMKSEEDVDVASQRLDTLLQSKPYVSMLAHYNRSWRPNHLPGDVFKRMILSLKFEDVYDSGENSRADKMLQHWRFFYQNMTLFEKNIAQLKEANLDVLINQGVSDAAGWLPDEWNIPDFYLYIHPNGGSTAFAHEGKQGYDFFQLPRDDKGNLKLNQMVSTVSHESHHLGLNVRHQNATTPKDSLAFYFLSLFLAEGAATKFVDKAPGGFIPSIGDQSKHSFSEEWNEYSASEYALFERFEKTLKEIYSGELDKQGVQDEMKNFWLSGSGKYPSYFVGAELLGAIYFGLGKQELFKVMKEPNNMLISYNEALKSGKKELKDCYVMDASLASRMASMYVQAERKP